MQQFSWPPAARQHINWTIVHCRALLLFGLCALAAVHKGSSITLLAAYGFDQQHHKIIPADNCCHAVDVHRALLTLCATTAQMHFAQNCCNWAADHRALGCLSLVVTTASDVPFAEIVAHSMGSPLKRNEPCGLLHTCLASLLVLLSLHADIVDV
jgi:hypothetical protein